MRGPMRGRDEAGKKQGEFQPECAGREAGMGTAPPERAQPGANGPALSNDRDAKIRKEGRLWVTTLPPPTWDATASRYP